MRQSLATKAAKITRSLGKIAGKSGTALPGLVAERIDPHLLGKLASNNFPKGIIVVTGTNGKTTTCKLIADMLEADKVDLIRNTAGSNLRRGILATILEHCDSSGKCQAEMALFEVDEAYIPSVVEELKPNIVVVTNLFRDQLDRYGELDSIARSFSTTFTKHDTQLVLNADDPLVASLGRSSTKKPIYYGVDEYSGEKIENDHTADSIFDDDGNKLQYLQRYFGHIGIYRSKNGNGDRPKPDYSITKMHKMTKESSEYDVETTVELFSIKSPLPGLYNVYNSLAAIAVATTLGVRKASIVTSLAHTEPAFGRGENLAYRDKYLQMMLIKNPTGFNQVIQTFIKPKPQNTPILIAINDKLADGQDVSWLWDSALEDIAAYQAKVVVSGTRAFDMALRLKYAGFAMENVIILPDLEEALVELLKATEKGSTAYVLPTYTAMLTLRGLISAKGNHKVKGISE